jgi:hypothetical protein
MPDDLKPEPPVEPESWLVPLPHIEDSVRSEHQSFVEEVQRYMFAAVLGKDPKTYYVNKVAVQPREKVGDDLAVALDDPRSSVCDLVGDELGAEGVVEKRHL